MPDGTPAPEAVEALREALTEAEESVAGWRFAMSQLEGTAADWHGSSPRKGQRAAERVVEILRALSASPEPLDLTSEILEWIESEPRVTADSVHAAARVVARYSRPDAGTIMAEDEAEAANVIRAYLAALSAPRVETEPVGTLTVEDGFVHRSTDGLWIYARETPDCEIETDWPDGTYEIRPLPAPPETKDDE